MNSDEVRWLERRMEILSRGKLRLWRKRKTRELQWAKKKPGSAWYRMDTIYEDELPKDIPDKLYDWWFANSIVDGVRIGPEVLI